MSTRVFIRVAFGRVRIPTILNFIVGRSERGVVFFRDAVLSPEEQVILVDKLGKLGGKPSDSTLHIHPLTLEGSAYGDEISVISNEFVFDSKFSRPKRVRVKGDTLWVSGDREWDISRRPKAGLRLGHRGLGIARRYYVRDEAFGLCFVAD